MTNMHKKVKIHYKGTLDDGEVFDSSYDRGEPLEFVCGGGQVIEGFDSAVIFMAPGEKKTIHLEPAEAYGDADPKLVKKIPVDQIPNADKLPVGGKIALQGPGGQPMPAQVISVDDEFAVFDLNHPLAGKALNFDLELVEVDD